jgi:hypothetical protein
VPPSSVEVALVDPETDDPVEAVVAFPRWSSRASTAKRPTAAAARVLLAAAARLRAAAMREGGAAAMSPVKPRPLRRS